jgi:hypothetical protein
LAAAFGAGLESEPPLEDFAPADEPSFEVSLFFASEPEPALESDEPDEPEELDEPEPESDDAEDLDFERLSVA